MKILLLSVTATFQVLHGPVGLMATMVEHGRTRHWWVACFTYVQVTVEIQNPYKLSSFSEEYI